MGVGLCWYLSPLAPDTSIFPSFLFPWSVHKPFSFHFAWPKHLSLLVSSQFVLPVFPECSHKSLPLLQFLSSSGLSWTFVTWPVLCITAYSLFLWEFPPMDHSCLFLSALVVLNHSKMCCRVWSCFNSALFKSFYSMENLSFIVKDFGRIGFNLLLKIHFIYTTYYCDSRGF